MNHNQIIRASEEALHQRGLSPNIPPPSTITEDITSIAQVFCSVLLASGKQKGVPEMRKAALATRDQLNELLNRPDFMPADPKHDPEAAAMQRYGDQHLANLMRKAAKTSTDNGIDLTQHATCISGIAGEVAETLGWIDEIQVTSQETVSFCTAIVEAADRHEAYRRTATDHHDHSTIIDRYSVVEELADIVLRVFSYAAGNGMETELVAAIHRNDDRNQHRPPKNGKGF
jgi:NTP pyrophosphatase (non-canonical NTP hydrolase)